MPPQGRPLPVASCGAARAGQMSHLTSAPAVAASMPASSPFSDRRRSVHEFLFFLGATSAFQGSRLAVNLVAASVLPVADYGFWGLSLVLLTYTTYANMGILSGANRAIPILLGQGGDDKASRTEAVAFGGTLVSGVVGASLVMGVCISLPSPWPNVAVPLAAAVLAQQIHLFYQVSLRGRMEFDRASAQQLILSVVLLAAGLPLLRVAGVPGLLIGYAAVYFTGALVIGIAWRRSLRPAFAGAELLSLIGPGLPIMLAGLLFGILVSVDRWVIVSFLGDDALGQYTLASTLSSSVQLVFILLAQQFYPRMGRQVGRIGAHAIVIGTAHRHSLFSLLAVLPVAVTLIAISPIAVPMALPRYAASVPPLQVLAFGFAILALSSGYTNMLVAVGRYWHLLALHLVVLGAAVLLSVAAIHLGFGLIGVAIAATTSFALLTAGACVLAWSAVRG